MLKKVWSCVSLRERFLCAAVFYTGIGLLMLAIAPNVRSAHAELSCPDGQVLVQIDEENSICQCP